MKNEKNTNLFSKNIDRLYAAAKEKHGEAQAETALTDAVRKTAGKFKKLGEKAYITGLLQELGVSAFYQNEEPAPGGLVAAMESAFAEGLAKAKKKSRLFAILGGAAAVVCIAVAVGFALRPGAAPFGDFELTNVHTINDRIGFDGDFVINVTDGGNEEQAATTVAPDGTVYLLTVCATDVEAEKDTFGLFRMNGESWEEVCRFEQKFTYYESTYDQTKMQLKYTARCFVFCDAESRPVVFLYDVINEMFTAYLCDGETGKAEVAAEIPLQIGMVTRAYKNITACADGERVYFAACSGDAWVDILIFDLKSHEFRQGGEVLSGRRIFLNAIVHRDDRTYLLVLDSVYGVGDTLSLCVIKDVAEETQELIFEKQLYTGEYCSIYMGIDGASLLMDDAGKTYVFFSYTEGDVRDLNSYKHALEVVSAEGESLTSKRYSTLKKTKGGTGYGIFMGPDGTLYFIEKNSQQISVGVFTGADYGEIREAASFQGASYTRLLQPQFISDPAGEEGLFIDLLGVSMTPHTIMKYSYMRLQLK